MRYLFVFLWFACCAVGAEYTLPAGQQGEWIPDTDVGVIGGIDQYRVGGASARTDLIDVTQAPYNADNTGATDASADIQDAINAATAGQVVYLPAGDYRIESTLSVGFSNANITIRGAGPANTRLNLYTGGAYGVIIGTGETFSNPASDNIITGAKTKGTTVLEMDDTSFFTTGKLVRIYVENEQSNTAASALDPIVMEVYGALEARAFMAVVTSKNSSSITVWPPLPADFTGLDMRVLGEQLSVDLIGIEDLLIDGDPEDSGTGKPTALRFEECYQCWARNVSVRNVENYHLSSDSNVRCEWRYNDLRDRTGAGSNGAGFLSNTNSACLFEDNIITQNFPCIEVNAGTIHSVIAYNFVHHALSSTAIITNHGPHNSHNLYEGNYVSNIKSDGYFGSASNDTFFRNYIVGDGFTIALNRFTRQYYLVGNIIGEDGVLDGVYSFGNPNIGNSDFDGTAEPSTSDFWADWKLTGTLTTRTDDNTGVVTMDTTIGQLAVANPDNAWGPSLRWSNGRRYRMKITNIATLAVTFDEETGLTLGDVLPAQGTVVEVYAGQGGFQEKDLDVENSTTLVHNYLSEASGVGAIPAGEDLGADTLPASLIYGSKPSFFRSLSWPPYNPESPDSASEESIPAGYRYLNNEDPPAEGGGGGSGTATGSTINATTIQAP